MAGFEITYIPDAAVLQLLDSIPYVIADEMEIGLNDAGKVLVRTAQGIVEKEDAIGFSRQYYEGWRFNLDFVRDDKAQGTLTNIVPYAEVLEFGRAPGKPMPPETPEFLQWMDSKGIDRRASFVIRRAIGRDGTIKRKGYQGLDTFQQTADMASDEVYDTLEKAFDRAVRGLQA